MMWDFNDDTKQFWVLDHRLAQPRLATDPEEWGRACASPVRFTRKVRYGSLMVSTVFLGSDHNFLRARPEPILWETAVFSEGDVEIIARYTTRAKAVRGHRRTASRLRRLRQRQRTAAGLTAMRTAYGRRRVR